MGLVDLNDNNDIFEAKGMGIDMDALSTILDTKIIAISRGNYNENLIGSVEALYRAGIRAVEVTFEQDKGLEMTADSIKALSERFYGRMAIGAGTVLTLEQLECAHSCGASYIVSPNTDQEIISATKKLGLVSIPGAMTPTEIVTAHKLGADIVKVFPAGLLGAKYFKALRSPLPNIRLAAVAGITLSNLADFAAAGACAFGISSGLFKTDMIADGRFSEIERIAREYSNRSMQKND